MRWSLISLIAAALLAVALARTRSAHSPPATDLIPLTRPELLALLRAAALRAPAATWRTPCTGHAGAAVTSTARRPATAAGTRLSRPPLYEHERQRS